MAHLVDGAVLGLLWRDWRILGAFVYQEVMGSPALSSKFNQAMLDEGFQLIAGGAEEGLHLRMAGLVVGAFDKDEADLVLLGGTSEFALGRGNALSVFEAIVVPEEADIDRATVYFIEVKQVGTAVCGREILEEENLEVALEEWVALYEIGQGATFGGQFFLD